MTSTTGSQHESQICRSGDGRFGHRHCHAGRRAGRRGQGRQAPREERSGNQGARRAAAGAGPQHLPLRYLRLGSLLRRCLAASPGHRGREERRRGTGRQPEDRAGGRPQGGRRGLAGGAESAPQGRQGEPRRSRHHARPAQAQCGGRADRQVRRRRPDHLAGDPMRPMPLERRRLVRTRHRQAPGRLGQPRPERRRHRLARAESQAFHRSAARRRGHRQASARELGAWLLRRVARQGRESLAPGRRAGVHADSARVRARRGEPGDLDRLRAR